MAIQAGRFVKVRNTASADQIVGTVFHGSNIETAGIIKKVDTDAEGQLLALVRWNDPAEGYSRLHQGWLLVENLEEVDEPNYI